MTNESHLFSNKNVEYYFDGSFSELLKKYDREKVIVITDDNLFQLHNPLFAGLKIIKVRAGEQHKNQQSVDAVIAQLLELEADKNSVIFGVGGGVVTDMAGFAASIFKRGTRLVQVPTSILGMVDAAVGGKNGVDIGLYKNMVGTIYQPEAILFDYDFLKTLPQEEWVNGFAEIIKHACIKDAQMFDFLAEHQLQDFINDKELTAALIQKNVGIKTRVVLKDEFETGDRKLLNFGHTLGHAIENIHQLPHGLAISIGMVAACVLSEKLISFSASNKQKVINVLRQYSLPVGIDFNKEEIWKLLLMDKKRDKNAMNFILLKKIGEAVVQRIPLDQLKQLIDQLF